MMKTSQWLQRLLMNGTNVAPSPKSTFDDATPEQLDSILADSMSQLNVQEREVVLEELHGIRSRENPESNPVSVNLWLKMLDVQLQNNKRGTVYEVAEAIDRAYVTSTNFRLMFLRSCRYDPKAAAEKVIKFLEVKRMLFGQEKLTKKITLADLSDEDKECLASGVVQISKERDQSGREIILFFPSLHRNGTPDIVVIRARYYAMMSMIESEDTQKHGIVSVYFGNLASKNPNQFSSEAGLLWHLPIFFSAIHCCLSGLKAYVLMTTTILRSPRYLRPRGRAHYGSCTDCLAELSSYGIPSETFLTDSNEPRLEDHLAWYRRREEMELACATDSGKDTQTKASSAVVVGAIVPRPSDVLFGYGNRMAEGNRFMRNIVLEMLDEYNKSSRGRKIQLSYNVADEVKKTGRRFLKQNEKTKEWEEASPTEVSRKIAHTFRNIRRPSRAKKAP